MSTARYFLQACFACIILIAPAQAVENGLRVGIEAQPLRVKVGETVHFSALNRTGNIRQLKSISWDFNSLDRVEEDAHGQRVSHVFNQTGAYSVRVTAVDQEGRKDEAFCDIEVFPDTTAGPSITSNFEGGKTGLFFESSETFAFRLEWGNQFYFRLDNCRNREVSLRIVGYGPGRKQLPSVTPYANDDTFNDSYTLMYSTDYQGHDWHPYRNAEYTYNEAKATLTAVFKPETESIYFAWAVPWTMRNLRGLIDRFEENENFTWSIVGESLEGRPIISLTVTDFSRDNRGKKAVWVTGTQHAYEMAAGPVIEGMIDRLLEGNGGSRELLGKFVYNIVPLMNPDGVLRGGYRYNLHDVDLNRNWDSQKRDDWDSENSEPEVASVKQAMAEWVDKNQTLDLYFDMHCLTAIAEDLLMIKASPESVPESVRKEQDRFVKDFLQTRWFFRESESSGAANGNGYVSDRYASETGVISFTAEHCLGYIRTAGGQPQRATPALFRQLGRDYVELIEDYFQSVD